MEKLTEFKRWLEGSGLVEELTVDGTGAMPGSAGLYPQGAKLLWQRQDIVGNTTCRLRETFILRCKGVPGMTSANRVIALTDWLSKQGSFAPRLGGQQRIYTEKGKLTSAAGSGEGVYEISIIVEYTTEQEGE